MRNCLEYLSHRCLGRQAVVVTPELDGLCFMYKISVVSCLLGSARISLTKWEICLYAYLTRTCMTEAQRDKRREIEMVGYYQRGRQPNVVGCRGGGGTQLKHVRIVLWVDD